MRKYLNGLDNTPSGAKFARERYLDKNPGSTVIIGSGGPDRYLDIIPAKVVRMPPQLRLVTS